MAQYQPKKFQSVNKPLDQRTNILFNPLEVLITILQSEKFSDLFTVDHTNGNIFLPVIPAIILMFQVTV